MMGEKTYTVTEGQVLKLVSGLTGEVWARILTRHFLSTLAKEQTRGKTVFLNFDTIYKAYQEGCTSIMVDVDPHKISSYVLEQAHVAGMMSAQSLLTAEVTRHAQSLLRYAKHDLTCAWHVGHIDGECTCGLTKVKEELK